MSRILEIKQQLCRFLEGELARLLPEHRVSVQIEFADQKRELPMRTPIIAVGFLRAAGRSAGDYIGQSGSKTLSGRRFSLELALDIASPKRAGGSQLHEIFEAAAEAMLMGSHGFEVQEIECGPIEYRKDLECFCARATAKLSAVVYSESSEELIEEFDVRRLFDGL